MWPKMTCQFFGMLWGWKFGAQLSEKTIGDSDLKQHLLTTNPCRSKICIDFPVLNNSSFLRIIRKVQRNSNKTQIRFQTLFGGTWHHHVMTYRPLQKKNRSRWNKLLIHQEHQNFCKSLLKAKTQTLQFFSQLWDTSRWFLTHFP